jgi:hypothetical protein
MMKQFIQNHKLGSAITGVITLVVLAFISLSIVLPPKLPTSIVDVSQSGGTTDLTSAESVQMLKLNNLLPYQNTSFKIEATGDLPPYRVTFFEDYSASKFKFQQWLQDNELNKISLVQFDIITQPLTK